MPRRIACLVDPLLGRKQTQKTVDIDDLRPVDFALDRDRPRARPKRVSVSCRISLAGSELVEVVVRRDIHARCLRLGRAVRALRGRLRRKRHRRRRDRGLGGRDSTTATDQTDQRCAEARGARGNEQGILEELPSRTVVPLRSDFRRSGGVADMTSHRSLDAGASLVVSRSDDRRGTLPMPAD